MFGFDKTMAITTYVLYGNFTNIFSKFKDDPLNIIFVKETYPQGVQIRRCSQGIKYCFGRYRYKYTDRIIQQILLIWHCTYLVFFAFIAITVLNRETYGV